LRIGTVKASVWATRKAESLAGQTFLVVDTDGGEIVAADQVGAGKGDEVLLVTGTSAARFSMEAPVDAVVVAILDPNGSGNLNVST
jgi:ethanolamine utilization protein EutN